MNKKLLKDVLEWDVKSWSKALDYWEKKIDWDNVQNGLELGARRGGLSLWLALKGKSVVCSDARDVKLSSKPLHSRYKTDALIEYRNIDAVDIPYEDHFDLIVFKSLMGAIGWNGSAERQRKAFGEIHKALKPGGKVLFAENLAASPLHGLLRKKFIKWGAYWRYVTIDEMKGFLEDFATFELKATGFLGTFGGNESWRKFFASVDDWIFNKTVPDEWKYIVYGVAQK